MEKQNNEFLELLCNLYLVALLTALPLYTGQGYWQLGDTKYGLFRSITLICLGCWLAAGMPARFRGAAEMAKRRKRAHEKDRRQEGWYEKGCYEKNCYEEGWYGKGTLMGGSLLDWAVGIYGVCVLLSAVCSSYGELAWTGYEGWYMGAFSQLLFVGIYFFVSRQYGGARWPLYLGEGALALVTGLGLLHRLGIDPLGLLEGWNSGDWEYSHMLSTLGNINWLCGYYSVALAFLTVHFLLEKRRWLRMILYVTLVSAFILLGIQGSQSGLLILAVCTGICLWLGRHQPAVLKKVFLVLAGFFAGMPLIWEMMKRQGEKAAIVADGNVFDYVEWYMWAAGAAVCLGLFLLIAMVTAGKLSSGGQRLGRTAPDISENDAFGAGEDGIPQRKKHDGAGKQKKGDKRNQKRTQRRRMAFILGAVAAGAVLAGYLYRHPIEDSFGSGRGFLWRISLESFREADLKDKLLGAGPDCYGEAVFNKLGTGTEVWKDEHWEGAVFTNAHNEILSQLCNVGILGTLGYLAVFAAGFYSSAAGQSRKDKENSSTYYKWLGVLALAMYGTHALISFQQVLSTPLLFLVLGICESGRRRGGCKPEIRGSGAKSFRAETVSGNSDNPNNTRRNPYEVDEI